MNERLAEDVDRNLQIIRTIETQMNPEWSVVVFAGSVLHAQLLAHMLTEAGIPSRPVWGALSKWARRDAIEQFRAKKIRVLTNFNVLSEGFDAPKTRAVVIARLVQSDGLFLQMLGRGDEGPQERRHQALPARDHGRATPATIRPRGGSGHRPARISLVGDVIRFRLGAAASPPRQRWSPAGRSWRRARAGRHRSCPRRHWNDARRRWIGTGATGWEEGGQDGTTR